MIKASHILPLALFTWCDLGHAQASEQEPGQGSKAGSSAAEVDESLRLLYEEAKSAYARGEYENSLRLFAEVHRKTGHPALLFNMAQAERLSGPGHCMEASRLYNSYLQQEEEVPNEDEVLERLEELRPCVEKEEALLAAQATSDTEPAEPQLVPGHTPVLAKVLTVGGGVLLVGGTGLLIATQVRYGQVKQDCPCEPDEFNTWESLQKVSYGLIGVGAPTLLGGSIWWWASARPVPAQARLSEPRVSAPEGYGLGWRTRF